jgi:hypothetical protein
MENDGHAPTRFEHALYMRHGILDALMPEALSQGLTVTFANSIINQTISINCTTATIQNTNCSSAQTPLQYVVLPPGAMNGVGRTIYVMGEGSYSNVASTPTITLQIFLTPTIPTATTCTGGYSLTALTTGATTASQTNVPWKFESKFTTVTTGAAGTMLGFFSWDTFTGSYTAATSIFNEHHIAQTTAASSGFDLTGQLYACITAKYSTSTANQQIFSRWLSVTPLNFSF